MSQHAILAPSGAKTWMTCPGSAAMQRGLPDDSNDYSDEGTAAHLLASTCLEVGNDPWFYIGKRIVVGSDEEAVFDGALWADDNANVATFTPRRWYTVDQDMADHIAKYVAAVREYAEGAVLMLPEQRVSIEAATGEKGAAGTSDAAVVRSDELTIGDLKYGMGVKVYAKRNPQLMIYALGVREQLDMIYGPFTRFRFFISQPRLDHLDEWDCTAEELDAFAAEVKAAAAKALELYNGPPHYIDAQEVEEREDDHNVPGAFVFLKPSEEGCRWCKAKANVQADGTVNVCPALAKHVADTAGADFDAIAAQPPLDVQPSVPSEAEALAAKMAAIPLIEDWCKAIRAAVEKALFAGTPIPGWKIVQGKRGNRQWADEAVADAFLKKMRLPIEERCNLKLKSPTQIEKLLKETPRRLKRLEDAKLVTQRDGQPSVAPESDSRPAWTPADTSEDFTAVQPEEESLV